MYSTEIRNMFLEKHPTYINYIRHENNFKEKCKDKKLNVEGKQKRANSKHTYTP